MTTSLAPITPTRPTAASPPPAASSIRPDPPRFPDWVTETYKALDYIQNVSRTQPKVRNSPETNQLTPVERKCRR